MSRIDIGIWKRFEYFCWRFVLANCSQTNVDLCILQWTLASETRLGWRIHPPNMVDVDLDDADFGDVKDLPLFAFLQPEELGAWPLLMLEPDNQPNEHASVEHLIGTLAALQVHSFVDIYVTQDERNSSQYILQVAIFIVVVKHDDRLNSSFTFKDITNDSLKFPV